MAFNIIIIIIITLIVIIIFQSQSPWSNYRPSVPMPSGNHHNNYKLVHISQHQCQARCNLVSSWKIDEKSLISLPMSMVFVCSLTSSWLLLQHKFDTNHQKSTMNRSCEKWIMVDIREYHFFFQHYFFSEMISQHEQSQYNIRSQTI